MTNMMLARLTTLLAAHDAVGYTPTILAYAAEKGTAANLQRLASAFGTAKIATALPYATATVQSAYKKLPVLAALPYSENWWALGLGKGVTDSPGDLYLWAVFLDSYTAGAGGSAVPSLAETSRYMTYRVKNVVIVIIVAVAGTLAAVNDFFGIMDSPTAQAWGNNLSDWYFYQNVQQTNLNHLRSIQIPTPTIDVPPLPDIPVPELPPISFNDGGNMPTEAGGC
jgi:hypothetical protein